MSVMVRCGWCYSIYSTWRSQLGRLPGSRRVEPEVALSEAPGDEVGGSSWWLKLLKLSASYEVLQSVQSSKVLRQLLWFDMVLYFIHKVCSKFETLQIVAPNTLHCWMVDLSGSLDGSLLSSSSARLCTVVVRILALAS